MSNLQPAGIVKTSFFLLIFLTANGKIEKIATISTNSNTNARKALAIRRSKFRCVLCYYNEIKIITLSLTRTLGNASKTGGITLTKT